MLPSTPAPSSPAPAPAPAPAPPVLPSTPDHPRLLLLLPLPPLHPCFHPLLHHPRLLLLLLPLHPSTPTEPLLAAVCGQTENKLLLRPPTTVPSASILTPITSANRKLGLSSHSTPGPSPFVPPTSIATKKHTTKTGDSALFYPNKSSNSARNLFAINYCRDHPKTTKGDFKNAWKIVEGDPEKKAFYVKLSLHNKASSLKPDMKGSASSTLS
ncbi:hypothetical protein JB92DRAFT_3149672 [Gautieria morchelliformis]|nr:hypothetical protein JB92DRAFT_3149672 [Gautieria morchelliformis]